MKNIIIKNLGSQDYEHTLKKMRTFILNRTPDTTDEIWLLEHNPVFTLGQATKPEHLLNPKDIPVIQSDRGGQVTYHGPGQLVMYVLLDLKRYNLNIRKLVTILENSVIKLLADFKINAQSKNLAPGVYVNDAKICSLGLRVRKGYSYHGLSLNVNMELEPFTRINPCGYPNQTITQLKNLDVSEGISQIADKLANTLLFNLTQNEYCHE